MDRYTRIGSVILLLHDPSDILLELAKLLNYAGKENASTLSFVSMMLSWAALRLWIFPTYVVHSAMYGNACTGTMCSYAVPAAATTPQQLVHVA